MTTPHQARHPSIAASPASAPDPAAPMDAGAKLWRGQPIEAQRKFMRAVADHLSERLQLGLRRPGTDATVASTEPVSRDTTA